MNLFALICIILILVIILTVFCFYKYEKKENFGEVEQFKPKHKKKFSPIVSVDAIPTGRYPFVIENTTNYFNSDSPILCSGNNVGTNIGK